MLIANLQRATFFVDNLGSLFTLLKGSSVISYVRTKLLHKIQYLVNKYKLTIQLAHVDSIHHPADEPSRTFYGELTPISTDIRNKIDYLQCHPAVINYDPAQPHPSMDVTSDAWSTPDWLREKILYSDFPPTLDLFADYTNALCLHHCSIQNPFPPPDLHSHTLFYQPPYSLLDSTWQHILSILPHPHGIWGLVPYTFFAHTMMPMPSHTCHITLQVDYCHPTLPNVGAPFLSTLFFIPACADHCQCAYMTV